MDLLSDVLQQSGLQRRLLDLRHLPAATALRFPCERSMGFHVVTAGRAWVHAPGLAEPLALAAGDIAFMARGCVHVLATEPRLAGLEPQPIAGTWGVAAAPAAGAGQASVISGAYQLWHTPLHPLFAELPAWFVLPATQMPRLGPLGLAMALLVQESEAAGRAAAEPTAALGSDVLVHGLFDVMFVQLLREIVAQRGLAGSGWSQAVRDAAVHRAVALMQADLARPWSLELLAQGAGLSRTTLAERFRTAMGDTPLSHLRTLRLQKAMQLLGEPRRKLDDVAQAVGYQDAFSFSKAFKRALGVSPGEFRRRDAAERASPWRWGAADTGT
ncbi:MAG: AraC family transcriptional regulator [Ideonella sp. WA131b]|jgi:AraC-like DNA-binding protein|nr:AraC family transcriptional regulator [Ideonella sp. WA131b]